MQRKISFLCIKPSSVKAFQFFRMQLRSKSSGINALLPMVPGTGNELELRDQISRVQATPYHHHAINSLDQEAKLNQGIP